MERRTIIPLALAIGLLLAVGCASQEDLGDEAAAAGRWEDAVEKYNLAYLDEPSPPLKAKLENARTRAAEESYESGERLLEAREFADAIRRFEACLRYRPDEERYRTALAEARLAKRRYDSDQALARGRTALAERRLGEAKEALEEALRIYDANEPARTTLESVTGEMAAVERLAAAGREALAARQWRDALTHFEGALARWSNHGPSQRGKADAEHWIAYEEHLARGRALLEEDALSDALRAFEAAQTHQDTAVIQTLIADTRARLFTRHLAEARTHLQAERYRESIGSCRSAARYGSSAELDRILAEATAGKHYEDGLAHERDGEMVAAAESFSRSLQAHASERAQRARARVEAYFRAHPEEFLSLALDIQIRYGRVIATSLLPLVGQRMGAEQGRFGTATIINRAPLAYDHLELVFALAPLGVTWRRGNIAVPPGKTEVLLLPSIAAARTRGVAAQSPGRVTMTLRRGERAVCTHEEQVVLASPSSFPLYEKELPLLAAFVRPRDPAVARLLQYARDFLPNDAYAGRQFSPDTDRRGIFGQVNAIYAALFGLRLPEGAVMPSPSPTEANAPWVTLRAPSEVLAAGNANALEQAVLVASCLEAAGFDVALSPCAPRCACAFCVQDQWYPFDPTRTATMSLTQSHDATLQVLRREEAPIIAIGRIRRLGIPPLPGPGQDSQTDRRAAAFLASRLGDEAGMRFRVTIDAISLHPDDMGDEDAGGLKYPSAIPDPYVSIVSGTQVLRDFRDELYGKNARVCDYGGTPVTFSVNRRMPVLVYLWDRDVRFDRGVAGAGLDLVVTGGPLALQSTLGVPALCSKAVLSAFAKMLKNKKDPCVAVFELHWKHFLLRTYTERVRTVSVTGYQKAKALGGLATTLEPVSKTLSLRGAVTGEDNLLFSKPKGSCITFRQITWER